MRRTPGFILGAMAFLCAIARANSPAPSTEICCPGILESNATVRATVEAKGKRYAERGPKRADQPGEAMAYFLEQRLAPGMTDYPAAHMRTMLDEISAREAVLERGARSGPGGLGTWTELGPGNIGGRTRAIAIDPSDPT